MTAATVDPVNAEGAEIMGPPPPASSDPAPPLRALPELRDLRVPMAGTG